MVWMVYQDLPDQKVTWASRVPLVSLVWMV